VDAFNLIPSEMVKTDPYWLGSFAAVAGIAAQAIDEHDPKRARRLLRSTLAEFIASPVPNEELRSMLRGYLR
jgi:hypothetical protein